MTDQKLDNLLNLAMEMTEEERKKSLNLNVGYEGEEKWEVIVRYSEALKEKMEKAISLVPLLGGYGIASVTKQEIEWLSKQDEIEYIEKPKRLYFGITQAKNSSCINDQKISSEDSYKKLSGLGILVGIVDSGIDYFDPNFRKEDGSSRILFLWDQNIEGSPPAGYKRGTEFTKKEIDEALKLPKEESQRRLPSKDLSGHGTAVALIAAGKEAGIAYDSDLLIVRMGNAKQNSFPRTSELLQGIDYLVKKAAELERPIAINLSFGNNYGSHRGDSLLETYIDLAAGYGRTVICTGTGNNGNQPLHTRGKISENEIQEIELSIGFLESTINIQLWKYYEDEMEIWLEMPSGEEVGPIKENVGSQKFVLEKTKLFIYYGKPGPYFTTQEIYFDFLPKEQYIDGGIWKVKLKGIRVKDGRYEMWLPGGNVLNKTTGFIHSVPQGTLTIPSTAKKIISVAAYDSRSGTYADFSGRGSSELFERKPDLAAPGVGISFVGRNNSIKSVTGTSFAVPFVTGSAALLMQWGIVKGNDPYLYGEKVKAYLRRGAQKIKGFTQYPNNEIGWGALCLKNSIPDSDLQL